MKIIYWILIIILGAAGMFYIPGLKITIPTMSVGFIIVVIGVLGLVANLIKK